MTLAVKMQIRSRRGHHWLRPPPMPFFASAEIDSCGGYRDLPRSQELKSHRPSNSLNQNAAKFLPTWKTWVYCKTFSCLSFSAFRGVSTDPIINSRLWTLFCFQVVSETDFHPAFQWLTLQLSLPLFSHILHFAPRRVPGACGNLHLVLLALEVLGYDRMQKAPPALIPRCLQGWA